MRHCVVMGYLTFPYNSTFNDLQRKKPFENIQKNGENTEKPTFSLFPTTFSNLAEQI